MTVEKNKRRDQESSHKVYLWKYYRLQANFTSPQSWMSNFIYYTIPLSYPLVLSGLYLRLDKKMHGSKKIMKELKKGE